MNARASALVRSVLDDTDGASAASPPEQRARLLAQVVNHSKVRVTVTEGPDAGLSRELVVNGPVQLCIGQSVLAIEPLDEQAARTAAPDAGPPEPLVPLRTARREATQAFERAYLANVLKRTRGNVTRAAALAEVSRQMMQKLMRKHGAD